MSSSSLCTTSRPIQAECGAGVVAMHMAHAHIQFGACRALSIRLSVKCCLQPSALHMS